MLRRVALAVALLVSFVPIGLAQTADEIVAKTLAAQGGADKMKAIQSQRMTGTMTLPGIGEVPIVLQMKRPAKLRVDMEIQGAQNTEAYDGQMGWLLLPAQGMKSAQPAPSDMMKDLEEQADMDGPMVDYKQKGNTIELIGKEPVQGTDAFKLKVTTKAGDVRYVFIDAEHFLPIKLDSKRTINGVEAQTSTTLGDYKEVASVMIPHSIESSIQGAPVTQKVTIQKVEVNIPIDDAIFKMPVTK